MNVIFVHTDSWFGDMYRAYMEPLGISLRHAASAQDCVNELDKQSADCLILDTNLKSHNAVEVLHELQSYDDWREIPVILLSNQKEGKQLGDNAMLQSYGVKESLYILEASPTVLAETVQRLVA